MSCHPSQWAFKKSAGWSLGSMPSTTQRPPGYTDWNAQQYLNQHFPYQEGHRSIMESENLSMGDRVGLLTALRRASAPQGMPQSSVRLGDFLPEVVGAGAGYLASSLIAPIFSLSDTQKKVFGIGSAALGAVLNNVGRR